jgi:hypothetical protein
MNLHKSIALLSFLIVLPGCMKQIHVASNTFADRTIIPCGFFAGQSFSITATNNSQNLFEKEVSQKIAYTLEEIGYEIAITEPSSYAKASDSAKATSDKPADPATLKLRRAGRADFELYYRYERTSSKELINTPKYIPGTEQTTYGTGNAHGNACTPFGCYHNSGSVHYQETTITPGSVVYVPETVTLFTHKISIDVYRINPFLRNKKKELVWQGSAVCCDKSADRRYIMDYLLQSVFKHFGKDTKKNVHKEYIDWF